jgi:hypothetical protein
MITVPVPVQITTQWYYRPNIELYYPCVSGPGHPAAIQKINAAILGTINKLIARQCYYQNPQVQITGWYELKTNERNVLSLTIGNYGYSPGAAHGMTYLKSLTFDVTSGKLYSLAELFKAGSDYVKVISDIVAEQIKERDIPTLQPFTGIKPDQDYYIADKSLVIYFQLYDLTAYVYGFPMFPISVFEIQDIIEPGGILERMATSS